MNQELRDKMNHLAGMIEAIRFPLIPCDCNKQGYHDLIDSIAEQYEAIMEEVTND